MRGAKQATYLRFQQKTGRNDTTIISSEKKSAGPVMLSLVTPLQQKNNPLFPCRFAFISLIWVHHGDYEKTEGSPGFYPQFC
jgi:hypothetical protein